MENPGVWIKDNKSKLLSESLKISSVGVRIRHGITEYGIALNINPDLKYLNTFEMCGLKTNVQLRFINNLVTFRSHQLNMLENCLLMKWH